MRREWEPEELIACWTLAEGDAALVGNKSGPTRLGSALLLKLIGDGADGTRTDGQRGALAELKAETLASLGSRH